MLKIINVISEIDKSLHFEWLAMQLKTQFEYQTILIGKKDSEHQRFLERNGFIVYGIEYSSKKDFIKVWWMVFRVLIKHRPKIIHTHFWIAHLVGISAAWILQVPQRIMTRHHADYHHNYFPKGVVLDKILNKMASKIIAPTQLVKDVIVRMENGSPKKIQVIHHGLDMNYLRRVDSVRMDDLRVKYKLDKDCYPVIGVISRYFELKGIHFIIPAFKRLLEKYPKSCLVLANASGDYSWKIKEMLADVNVVNYREVEYEHDVIALYKLFDVFVHTPIDLNSESFGLVYIEALALEVPSVFTISGIAVDFVKDRYNALIARYKNENDIYDNICAILENKSLTAKLKLGGSESVKPFTMEKMASELASIYLTE